MKNPLALNICKPGSVELVGLAQLNNLVYGPQKVAVSRCPVQRSPQRSQETIANPLAPKGWTANAIALDKIHTDYLHLGQNQLVFH